MVFPKSSSLTTDVYKRNAQMAGGISCEVRGRYGSYAYVVVGTKSGGADGSVKYTRLKKEISSFLNLSSKDINVWGDGTTDPSKKLITSYKGDVKWFVGDNTIIDFDEATGQIIGLKPGVTTKTLLQTERIKPVQQIGLISTKWKPKSSPNTERLKL